MVALQSYALMLVLAGTGQVPGVGETVLLDFTADWCGPCQTMKPTVRQLAAAGYPVREVNIDQHRELAARYRVTSIPCFVMLVNGQEVDRELGATSQTRLTQMLSKGQVRQAAPTAQPRALAQSPDNLGTSIPMPTQSAAGPPTDAYAQQLAVSAQPTSYGAPAASPGQSIAGGQANNLEQRLVSAAVRLKVEDPQGHSFGTGTIIDARGDEALVLTCGHIFRDSEGKGSILVDLDGGHGRRQVQGMLISYDLKRDLGLVSIRPGGPVEVAPVAAEAQGTQMGQRVISVGCNNGQAASARSSHVTGIDKYLGPPNVEVAGLPVEGRSGGGLFNQTGELIGVCFAADPADNEGVYAGLPSIHAELDRLGLTDLYAANVARANPAPPAAQLPALPSQMPNQLAAVSAPAAPLASVPVVPVSNPRALAPASAMGQMSATEQAALAEISARAKDSEVICIIRPRENPGAKSEIIVLNNASPMFLEQLSQGQRAASDSRHLTSLEVRNPAAQPAPAVGQRR